MATINIPNGKTRLKLKISSEPSKGTVSYVISYDAALYPNFFNRTVGTLTYTGGTIYGDTEIYANENDSAEARDAEFKLTATTDSSEEYEDVATVTCAWTITQEGTPIEPRIELTTSTPQIPATAAVITYTIKSNTGTTVKYGEESRQYPETEGITESFSVPQNTGDEPVVHVISGWCTDDPSVSATTTVTQSARDHVFSVSPLSLSFAGTGETKQITVTNPNGYNWIITDLPGWLTANPITGNATMNVNITAANNNTGAIRTGSFKVNETSFSRTAFTVNCSQDVPQEPKIKVRVSGEVISSGGGACDYIETQWTGLRVGSYIDLSAVNATIGSSHRQIEVTSETGSVGYANEPTVPANSQTAGRTVSVTATWRDNTSVRDTYSWTQEGQYTVYELTVRGYNDDTVNSFDGVNDTQYVVQEYRMNCNTSIGNFGTLREIDIDEYGNNSFGLPRESVSNIYDDTSVDVTLTINPKSSSGNHPAYCTLQWSLDDYSDYKVAYDSNLNQYRFDSSISYPAGIIGRIFYIKKIIFSNN
jgi:hypothetical protein